MNTVNVLTCEIGPHMQKETYSLSEYVSDEQLCALEWGWSTRKKRFLC